MYYTHEVTKYMIYLICLYYHQYTINLVIE